jgi:hypothetical protein
MLRKGYMGQSTMDIFDTTFAGDFTRVARWFLFKPNIPIWVNFGGPVIEKC